MRRHGIAGALLPVATMPAVFYGLVVFLGVLEGEDVKLLQLVLRKWAQKTKGGGHADDTDKTLKEGMW